MEAEQSPITNLRFAGDIDGLAEEDNYLTNLPEHLDKASRAYGISAKNTKLMTNNTSGISTEIKAQRLKLETITSFNYLGSVVADNSSKPEIPYRIHRQQQH